MKLKSKNRQYEITKSHYCKVCEERKITYQTWKFGKGMCGSCGNIRRKQPSKYSKILTKDFLYQEYIVKSKGSNEIAKMANCGNDTVLIYLKNNNIPIRTLSEALKGIPKSLEARKKMSKALTGKFGIKNNHYIDGRTSISDGIRHLLNYKNWRIEVFKRDYYTCQHCGDNKGHNLNAHHKIIFGELLHSFLKEYDQFSPIEDKETLVRLAIKYKPFWDINNGQTLCEDCHIKVHIILHNEIKEVHLCLV